MPNWSAGQPPTGEKSPPMPSFASLRDPRRRTALDVLMAPAPDTAPAPDPERVAAPARAWASTPLPPGPAPAPGPRPAEYADLLRFGVRVARAAVAAPVRLVRWSLREQAHCLRHLAR